MYKDNDTYKIRVADLTFDSEVDGPGLRTVLWMQGCNHHCPGCHNPSTHEFTKGTVYEYPYTDLIKTIEENSITNNLTLSGGDPLYQWINLTHFLKIMKSKGWDICLYTGFTVEQIKELEPVIGTNCTAHYKDDPDIDVYSPSGKPFAYFAEEFIPLIDLWICDPFIDTRRSLSLKYRGSTNQRIGKFEIDIQAEPSKYDDNIEIVTDKYTGKKYGRNKNDRGILYDIVTYLYFTDLTKKYK